MLRQLILYSNGESIAVHFTTKGEVDRQKYYPGTGIAEVYQKTFKQYVFLYIFGHSPPLVTVLSEEVGTT